MPKKIKSIAHSAAGGALGGVIGAVCGPVAGVGGLYLAEQDTTVLAAITIPVTAGIVVAAVIVPGVVYGVARGIQVGMYEGCTNISEVPKELFNYSPHEEGMMTMRFVDLFLGFEEKNKDDSNKKSGRGSDFFSFWSKDAKEMRKEKRELERENEEVFCKKR